MKKLLASLVLSVLVCLVHGEAMSNAEILKRPVAVPSFGNRERLLNSNIPMLMARFHYSPKKLTPELSSQWFNEYFKALDNQKIFFLESDLQDFRSYENTLCSTRDAIQRLEFVSKVYERLLQRVHQYAVFSSECVNAPHDFSLDEKMLSDRKNEPWCKTMDELHEVWRLRVKNSLLLSRLEEEEEARKKAEKAAKKEGPEETDKDDSKPAYKRPPIKERLAKAYAQSYQRRLDLTPIEILEQFLSAFTRIFDPHSTYMAPESKEEFDIHMRLSLQGIGATLTTKDSYCEVVSLVPGGPADKEGTLKEGDRIIEVCQDGGEPVDVVDMNLSKIVQKIRGKKGTKVRLTILEEGSDSPKYVTIVRDEIKLTDSEASSEIKTIRREDGKESKILVLYLPSFYSDFAGRSKGDKNFKSSSNDVRKLLEAGVKDGGIDGVMLDFRNNGGGSLADAVALAGLFFKDGPVVQIRRADGRIEQLKDPDDGIVYSGPLMVMVDRQSASASEIVAAALQDMGRALIIGTSVTHGKGTVQNMWDLDRVLNTGSVKDPLGALKFTIQKFYRINGASTQIKGIESDIVFPSYMDNSEYSEGKLPYCLPWDEIKTTGFTQYDMYSSCVKALRTASEKHRAASTDYQAYEKDVKEYMELLDEKYISLNYEQRKAERNNSERVRKQLRKLIQQNKEAKNRAKRKKNTEEEEEMKDARDVILDESLFIMGKYLEIKGK